MHVRWVRGGGVVYGNGKPFLEIQGAFREPWAGAKKPSVFLVHVSLSPAVIVFVAG